MASEFSLSGLKPQEELKSVKRSYNHLQTTWYIHTILRLTYQVRGGGNSPPLIFGRISSKNWISQSPKSFRFFLIMYMYTLTPKKKNCYVISGRRVVLRGVSLISAYFGRCILYISSYHNKCLNILKFCHWFHFWFENNLQHFYRRDIFERIWPCLTGHSIYRAIARRSACAWFQLFIWNLQSM